MLTQRLRGGHFKCSAHAGSPFEKAERGIDTIFEAKKKSLDNTDGNKQKNDSIYIYNIQSSQRGYKFISPPKPSILTSFEKATNERVSCPDSATSKPSGSFFLMGSSFYLNTYRDGWGLGGDIGHIAGIVVEQHTFIVRKRGQEVRSILVFMVYVYIYIYIYSIEQQQFQVKLAQLSIFSS